MPVLQRAITETANKTHRINTSVPEARLSLRLDQEPLSSSSYKMSVASDHNQGGHGPDSSKRKASQTPTGETDACIDKGRSQKKLKASAGATPLHSQGQSS
jgi:hypothetical protein